MYNDDIVSTVITKYGKKVCYSNEEKINFVEKLTPFEKKVYLMLLEGFTMKETSKQLGIRYFTASSYQRAIFRKLHISTRAELIINYRDIGAG